MATYLLTGIDDEEWRRFKASCDLQGITIKEFFLDCIDTAVRVFKQEQLFRQAALNKQKKGGKKK